MSGQPLAAGADQMAAIDSGITAQIEQKVRSDETLSANARKVSVETHNQEVTLRGTVDTRYDHLRLSEIAAGVATIHKVNNQTVVAADSIAGNAQR
jgi:osmotically-inducible protein OsmY